MPPSETPTTIPIQLPRKLRAVFDGPARYRGAYGGRGSGKSRSFAAVLLADGMREPGPILCARELQSSLKDSVHAELCGLVDDLGLGHVYEYGREFLRTRPGHFPRGGQTEFVYSGLRHNSQSIKSKSRFRRCWVEEAEYVSEQSWKDLIPTIRMPGSEIWLTWNPEVKGSATDRRFIESPPSDCKIAALNWRDNPWFPAVLDQERRNDLRRDPDAYANVWEGKYATRSDAQVMAGKWSVEAFEPDPATWGGPYDGADWGFAVDPTVRVRCWTHGGNLYVEREAYGKQVELLDLPALFDRFPDSRKVRIRADSARPETISLMASQGFRIEAVAKWAGSVEDGIAHVRGGYDKVIVHPRCVHTAEEMRLYSYKVDRNTGEVLPDVIDKHNHIIDAIRYSLQPLIKRPGRMTASPLRM